MHTLHKDTTYTDYVGEQMAFSWTPCDTCGSPLGGERHTIYDRQNDMTGKVCTDCLLYITYPDEYPCPEGF